MGGVLPNGVATHRFIAVNDVVGGSVFATVAMPSVKSAALSGESAEEVYSPRSDDSYTLNVE